MYFYSNVIAIVICVNIGFVRIHSEREEDSEIEAEKKEEPEKGESHEDTYTFLTLIDVVYTDGSQTTCTGTIIHDNVVITAAHSLSTDERKVELTASFVVIGTKRMFDAGYEQYLPIERVIIHPNYRGWTADLALVYTFAGMMSDKPGKVVRLANERTSVPDSDITVYSWGHGNPDDGDVALTTTRDYETPCSDEDEIIEREVVPERKLEVTDFIRIHSGENKVKLHAKSKMHRNKTRHSKSKHTKRNKKRKHLRKGKSKKPSKDLPTTLQKRFKKKKPTKSHRETTFDPDNLNFHQRPKIYKDNQSSFTSGEDRDTFEHKEKHFKEISRKSKMYNKKKGNRRAFTRMSYYKNTWRRIMGNQKSTLTAEIFSFVDTQTCTKLTEKTISSSHEIENPNEILCYANEAVFITEEDFGAPALRQGRLVAVTVGVIDYDGEYVAVGMKIICFCHWIVKNIPKTDNEIQCCNKCCEPKIDEGHNLRYKKKKYDEDDEYVIKNKS